MKSSEILSKAKTRIEVGSDGFICLALKSVRRHLSRNDQKKADQLIYWIARMLDGRRTYGDWLRENHKRVAIGMTLADARDGRLQWLDWMIKECEKQGD